MSERLIVGLGDRSYPIWIGEDLIGQLPDALAAVNFPKRIGVVTNPTVADLFQSSVLDSLKACGYQVTVISIPDGEEFKNLRTLEEIYDALIQNFFDRYAGIIALGGGVVGDITGFAAATFLRGIPFVQIPTTLLSQVDSSVGGKTGVNHPLGKYLIGAFYQPRHVHIDVGTLKTLPAREFSAGMAEVIKYGVIADRDFFHWLQLHRQELLRREMPVLIEAVKKSCQIKADIVERDEKEGSLRAILNFGHTFGHAVENLAGYGEYRHGEAVAIGMVFAATLSHLQGRSSAADLGALRALLGFFDLPTSPPAFSPDQYLEAMGRDKKARAGALRFIINLGMGDCLIEELADPKKELHRVLTTMMDHQA